MDWQGAQTKSMGRRGMDGEADIRRYLSLRYSGVFDQKQLQCHIKDYVEGRALKGFLKEVMKKSEKGFRLFDVGCGFGSFVLAARKEGLDAVGIEIEEFEITLARNRLMKERPADDPQKVFLRGSALTLPFEKDRFDIVCLWNILEHVYDYKAVLQEAARVLKKGGRLWIVSPNYLSVRREAHYEVVWPLWLPRKIASYYLKILGKKSEFFEKNIFYTTNWGILFGLKRNGMKIYDPRQLKLSDENLIESERIKRVLNIARRLRIIWLIRAALYLSFYNPFKKSIVVMAEKV